MHILFWTPVGGFLCGSIPFGVLVGKRLGIDIQKRGSGNIGFANSLRVMGWKPALIVLIADISKGYVPTLFALHYFGLGTLTLLTSFAAVVGHILSPWLGFRGGKGVATMIGVTMALCYPVGLLAAIAWIILFRIWKTASVGSLAIPFLILFAVYFVRPQLLYFYVVMVMILLITLRSNIAKLIAGNELTAI